jgi:hypothetical protein
MTKTKSLLAAIAMAAFPTLATAECYGTGHNEASMSCAAGTVWDAEAQSCVPTTG